MKKKILALVMCVAMLCGCSNGAAEAEGELSCSIEISCEELLEKMEKLDEAKREIVPKDGIIFYDEEVFFSEGDNAFDVLKAALDDAEIQMEYTSTVAYNSVYIEGIGNIYEGDCGDMSGWGYTVNGEFPDDGINNYILQDGDELVLNFITSYGE